MSQCVHIICGVPGSGKSWAIRQADTSHYHHIPHPQGARPEQHAARLAAAAHASNKPILTEAPYAVRALQQHLSRAGVPSKTYHVDTPLHRAQAQYEARENGKPYPAMHANNHRRYHERTTWDHRGSAEAIARMLSAAPS
jgi:hypothetical protein